MGEILLPYGTKVMVACETGQVSDGFHTFDELYEHRCLLMIGVMRLYPLNSWRARKHADGTMWDGWFVVGMKLPTGMISYHLPLKMWDLLDNSGIQTKECAPEWDGHTSADVIERLTQWYDLLRALHLGEVIVG